MTAVSYDTTTVPPCGILSADSSATALPYVTALNTANRSIIWLVAVEAAVYREEITAAYGPLVPTTAVPTTGTMDGILPVIGTETLRWASRPFVTAAADSPSKTYIDGRLLAPTIVRELGTTESGMWAPVARIDVGEIELANTDGELDGIGAGYYVEGRNVKLYAGAATLMSDGTELPPPLSEFGIVYKGEVDSWSYSRRSVLLRIRNQPRAFEKPITGTEFTGHGGSSGSPEIAGLRRPVCYGIARNVPAVLVDPVRLIYQLNDGEMRAVDVLRDAGVALNMVKNVESYAELAALTLQGEVEPEDPYDLGIGDYAICPTEGYIRLGSMPFGAVTADIRGMGGGEGFDAFFSDGTIFSDGTRWAVRAARTHRDGAAGIVGDILDYLAHVPLNRGSMDQTDGEFVRRSGLYAAPGESLTITNAANMLLAPVPAILLQGVDGVWWVRPLRPPDVSPVLVLTREQIRRAGEGPDLERLNLPYGRPWATWRIQHRRNWTPMSEGDLAGSVSGDDRVFLTNAYREVAGTDDVISLVYPDRPAGELQSLLDEADDARDALHGIFALYSLNRRLFRVVAKGIMFLVELGDTVGIEHERHGMSGETTLDVGDGELDIDDQGTDMVIATGAQHFLVVGIREDGAAKTTELMLWG